MSPQYLPPSDVPLLVIGPKPKWALVSLPDVWEFRDLLRTFAERDIKLRYKQTFLGVVWVILQPLMAAGIFTFVFGRIAKLPSDGVPYMVFAYAGLMCWTLFSQTVTKAASVMVGNAAMVTKVYFPRIILPLSVIASGLLDFLVAALMLAVLLLTYGISPGWPLLLLPLWVLLALCLAMGIGLALTALAVRYRDIQYILPVFIQLLLYASPIAYGLSAVPEKLRPYEAINPLTGILEAFRWSLLGTSPVSAVEMAWPAVAALAALVGGAAVFTSQERDFADVI